ncbi:hypothetical protein F2Q69_00023744 [Brassica cretica]|uniref:Uncharacterized protein n=1 Tax=Brassica cretica TaxID=69181 RepID=A0A8S9QMQ4_BRACR|nr:hypothetical protein F2Q69_00023744 [Brassica cretica]
MYISHPDEKERMARIQRVQLSIADKRSEEDNAMPVISYDLNKTKGWSLVMRREVTNSRVSVLKGLNDALLHPWTFLRMSQIKVSLHLGSLITQQVSVLVPLVGTSLPVFLAS